MRGTLAAGDVLRIQAVFPGELRMGDVVAFRSGGQVLAHRIVGFENGAFQTQGDSNWRPDSAPLAPAEIIGLVAQRERAGRLSQVAGGGRGLRRAEALHALAFLRWGILWLLAPAYRGLRARRWLVPLWRPRVVAVRFSAAGRSTVKFIHRGRTVACWNPQEERWTCRKPYDLVLAPPRA